MRVWCEDPCRGAVGSPALFVGFDFCRHWFLVCFECLVWCFCGVAPGATPRDAEHHMLRAERLPVGRAPFSFPRCGREIRVPGAREAG